jgi:hypothetical protein
MIGVTGNFRAAANKDSEQHADMVARQIWFAARAFGARCETNLARWQTFWHFPEINPGSQLSKLTEIEQFQKNPSFLVKTLQNAQKWPLPARLTHKPDADDGCCHLQK